MMPRILPRRQRGVALIIALVLMALATILAVKIGFGGYVERKRTSSMLAAEQAYQFAMGAEALAADVLSQDTNTQDELTEPWAQAPQPIPLRPPNDPEGEPLGTLEGSLEDQSGRFNLNNLLQLKDGKPDPLPLEQLQRILVALEMDPKWAQLARDWIDEDTDLSFPDGAEDAVYNSLDPPYRTGNYPLLSASELLNLPGFGVENYQKLAPYITALPEFTKINTCTAPGIILDTLTNSPNEFAGNPEFLQKNRKKGCFPDNATLANRFVAGSQQATDFAAQVTEKSKYYRLTTIVSLGSTEFTLYSLLWRNQSNRVTPVLRSFGTP